MPLFIVPAVFPDVFRWKLPEDDRPSQLLEKSSLPFFQLFLFARITGRGPQEDARTDSCALMVLIVFDRHRSPPATSLKAPVSSCPCSECLFCRFAYRVQSGSQLFVSSVTLQVISFFLCDCYDRSSFSMSSYFVVINAPVSDSTTSIYLLRLVS